MIITRTDEPNNKIKLLISLDSSELGPVKDHVIAKHFGDVKVPGFRVGRAPAQVIEQNLDQKLVVNDFLEHAINEYFPRALQQENVRGVGQPDIQVKKFVPYDQLEFEASLAVVGPVKLPDYKKIKLTRPKVEISTTEVNEVLRSLQQRTANRKESSAAIKTGDEAIIDFVGKDDKSKPVPGAEGKDFSVVIGAQALIPGFEDNLIGLKAGDTKKFALAFPSNYGLPELRSKKVSFSAEVKQVNELTEPKLDDAFAGKIGPFKNLADLKADIKKQLMAEREMQAQRDVESRLVKQIVDKSTVDIPQSLVEEQLQLMEDEEKRNLAHRGQTWQEHLRAEAVSAEQHRERYRSEAAERVKAGLALSEISIREKIQVTPEEINSRIAELKGQYADEAMRAELDNPANRQDVAARLLTDKTLQKLLEYSTTN